MSNGTMMVFQFGERHETCDWVVASSEAEAIAVIERELGGTLEEYGSPRALTVEEADATNFCDEVGTRLRSMFDEAARHVMLGTAPAWLGCSEW